MKLKIFVFNDFQVNTYLLYDDSKEAVVIDAACSTPAENMEIKKFITTNELKPVRLLTTHSHIDHLMGNHFFLDEYDLEAEGHASDVILIDNADKQIKIFALNVIQPPPISKFLQDNDIIEFGNSQLQVLHAPGHSPGSLLFYSKEQKFVIVGDVLFRLSIGRTDFPGGDHETIINSIKTKLLVLDDATTVYPGHGDETTIGNERLNNSFLR